MNSYCHFSKGAISTILATTILFVCSCKQSFKSAFWSERLNPEIVYFQKCDIEDPVVFKIDSVYYIAPSTCLELLDTLDLNKNENNLNQIFPLLNPDLYTDFLYFIDEIPLKDFIRMTYGIPLGLDDITTYQKTEGRIEFYGFTHQPVGFAEAFKADKLTTFVIDGICAEVDIKQYDTYRIYIVPVFDKKTVWNTLVEHYKQLEDRSSRDEEKR